MTDQQREDPVLFFIKRYRFVDDLDPQPYQVEIMDRLRGEMAATVDVILWKPKVARHPLIELDKQLQEDADAADHS